MIIVTVCLGLRWGGWSKAILGDHGRDVAAEASGLKTGREPKLHLEQEFGAFTRSLMPEVRFSIHPMPGLGLGVAI